jgi:hypothetical protein
LTRDVFDEMDLDRDPILHSLGVRGSDVQCACVAALRLANHTAGSRVKRWPQRSHRQGVVMSLIQQAVHISDRFMAPHYPDSIDRQERLMSCTALVSIFYMTLCMGLVTMSQLEKRHIHRVPHEVNVFIEMLKPPELIAPPTTVPQPAFDPGKPNIGGREARTDDKQTIQTNPGTPSSHSEGPVKQHPQHPSNVIEEPPVSVVSTNPISAKPIPHTVPVGDPSGTKPTPVEDPGNPGRVIAEDPTSEVKPGLGGRGGGKNSEPGMGSEPGPGGGELISSTLPGPAARVFGNITPYRDELVRKLAKTWRPLHRNEHLKLNLIIGKDGQLISSEVIESKSRRSTKNIADAVENTTFDPLPDWYRGESISFSITLNAVDSVP